MKHYIEDLIPKLTSFSKKLDNLSLLTDCNWTNIKFDEDLKQTYIFRSNKELLISNNGKVEKAKWEYLSKDSIIIEKEANTYLYRHGFLDEYILILKIDGLNS